MELVLEFRDVFIGPHRKVGFTDRVKHEINTVHTVPMKLGYLQKSFFKKENITAEVNKLTQEGQLWPPKLAWGASIIRVKKKDHPYVSAMIIDS